MTDSIAKPTAIRFTGNFDAIEEFVGGDAEFRDGRLVVATPQGPLYVLSGDWIIRSGKGRFSTCGADNLAEMLAHIESHDL